MNGKIALLKESFGFITAEDGKRYFFHRRAVQNAKFEELTVGDEVEIDGVGEREQGLYTERIFLK